MRRRLSTFASAASLVLCVATCVLWVRSYWYYDHVNCRPGTDLFRLVSCNGTLLIDRGDEWPWPSGFMYFNRQDHAGYHPADELGSVLGFACRRGVEYVEVDQDRPEAGLTAVPFVYVAVPYWLLVATLGPLPLRHVHRALHQNRRRRLVRAGRCPACGYDLRATPGRCPECGKGATEPARPV